MTSSPITRRLQQVWRSYRSLPLWVQVWVGGILVPANAAAFLMLDTWSGRMAAAAAVFVAATNIPIMYREGGMSRLMSLPHLVAWGPLQAALAMRLFGMAGPDRLSGPETAFVVMLLVVNGISLVFDTLDSWRWLRGERDIPGSSV